MSDPTSKDDPFDSDFDGFEIDLNPQFPSYFAFTQENSDLLIRQIRKLVHRDTGEFLQEEFFHSAGLNWPKQKISNWLNGGYKKAPLTEREFRQLCRFIEDKKLWDTQAISKDIVGYKDVFYHASLAFFGVKHGTEVNVVDRVPGLFKLYQPSMLFPNHFVVGMLKIWYSKESSSVKVYELQTYDGGGRFRDMKEEYEGYLYRKAKRYFIIQRDKSRNFSKFTILPGWWRSGDKIDFFNGVVMGMHGHRVYAFRVYLERFGGSEVELKSELGIKPKSEIAANVVHNLELPFTIGSAAYF